MIKVTSPEDAVLFSGSKRYLVQLFFERQFDNILLYYLRSVGRHGKPLFNAIIQSHPSEDISSLREEKRTERFIYSIMTLPYVPYTSCLKHSKHA